MTHTRIAGAPADEEAHETVKRVAAVHRFMSSLRKEVRAYAPAGPSFTSLETGTRTPTLDDSAWQRPRSSSSSSVSSQRAFHF